MAQYEHNDAHGFRFAEVAAEEREWEGNDDSCCDHATRNRDENAGCCHGRGEKTVEDVFPGNNATDDEEDTPREELRGQEGRRLQELFHHK